MADLGCVGSEGEYYYHPSKTPKLKVANADAATFMDAKLRTVPIFPYSSVLVPSGSEWLNIFEMKHRALFNNLPPGALFGFVYYSTQAQKLALVGTLARIKSRKLLDDGRSFVVIEGMERFHIQEFITERPYLKAKVQVYRDHSECSDEELDVLEDRIFTELRSNMRLMEHIFPQKNYSLSAPLLANRPSIMTPGVRQVRLVDQKTQRERRSKFSFAVLDMLQVSPAAKLSLLQEHVIERRLTRFLTVLETGGKFLREELLKKGMEEEHIMKIKSGVVGDLSDLDLVPDSSWLSDDVMTKEGEWLQKSIIM